MSLGQDHSSATFGIGITRVQTGDESADPRNA
jgi:hypothetical protein